MQSAAELRPELLRDCGDIVAERCPFDGRMSSSIEENLAHMAACHGFFVPYLSDLVTVSGLLEYLVRKVCLPPACVQSGGGVR